MPHNATTGGGTDRAIANGSDAFLRAWECEMIVVRVPRR
ncbi:hypothetical protein BTZ20_3654 [Rhodococcus sp. MTM3W5.2]|nr:hypothetical protein BTZ20_3654 [Rhodococcus sp. MTM3W5.2]